MDLLLLQLKYISQRLKSIDDNLIELNKNLRDVEKIERKVIEYVHEDDWDSGLWQGPNDWS